MKLKYIRGKDAQASILTDFYFSLLLAPCKDDTIAKYHFLTGKTTKNMLKNIFLKLLFINEIKKIYLVVIF